MPDRPPREDVPPGEDEVAVHVGDALLEFETAPIAMFMMLPDGRMLQANRAFRTMFDYEPADVVGVAIWDLVGPESRAIVKERLASVLETEGALPELTTELVAITGRRLTVHSSSLTVRDEAGRPQYIVGRLIRVRG
jgi:PAS domain S-box-containing protein